MSERIPSLSEYYFDHIEGTIINKLTLVSFLSLTREHLAALMGTIDGKMEIIEFVHTVEDATPKAIEYLSDKANFYGLLDIPLAHFGVSRLDQREDEGRSQDEW